MEFEYFFRAVDVTSMHLKLLAATDVRGNFKKKRIFK